MKKLKKVLSILSSCMFFLDVDLLLAPEKDEVVDVVALADVVKGEKVFWVEESVSAADKSSLFLFKRSIKLSMSASKSDINSQYLLNLLAFNNKAN